MRAACEALRLSLPLTLALACTNPPVGTTPTPPPAPASPVARRPSFTANNDVRGAGSQPNYDGEAATLRDAITPRLPEPLPEPAAACAAMLDAAAVFYGSVARDSAARTKQLADVKATRTADQTRCEQETSPRAATCVALRLAERDAEFPWLLDQCTRAFPD
jgi:hypothetical protein